MEATLTLTAPQEGSESTVIKTKSMDELCDMLAQDKVKALTLPGNMITEENLTELKKFLPQCDALEKVEINSHHQQQGKMELLCEAMLLTPKLRELTFRHAFSRMEGAEVSARLIQNHPTLEKLAINHNGLQLPGTQVVAPALAHSGGLRELDISYNAMGAPGVDLLADALTTNKGLVAINVDTTYDIAPSIPNIEKMLESNKNLMEIAGGSKLVSDVITERLQANREAATQLADALMADPEALDKPQREALNERMAATMHVLKTEKGLDHDGVMDVLGKLHASSQDTGVDPFPAMMTVLPFGDMLDMSKRQGNPLKAKDFFDPKTGATPLMQAAIDRGAGHKLFTNTMGWETRHQLMGAYKALPEVQRAQVPNIHQLYAGIRTQAEHDLGRRKIGEIGM